MAQIRPGVAALADPSRWCPDFIHGRDDFIRQFWRSRVRTLVIVPTYNEYDNLSSLVDETFLVDPTLDVLVVDDDSPDGTGILADALARRNNRLQVIHRPGKQGLGTAYLTGFRYALAHHYDRIVQMDADFSHRPRDLRLLLDASAAADVVIGSRNIPGGLVENWSLLRQLISRGGSLYTRTLLGLPVLDCTSGFKCFRREVLASLDLEQVRSKGFGFQVEMNYLCHRAGFRIIEVPITFPERSAGRSKMTPGIFLEALLLVWRLRGRTRVSPRLPRSDRPDVHVPAMGRDRIR